jgi:hypothetical protein
MDIGKSFTYIFEDKKWISKLLIGVLISWVPILQLALGGYANEIIRRVEGQHPEPLPDWDDLGKKFVEGLVLTLAMIIYSLPILIITCLFVPFLASAGAFEGDAQTAVAAVTSGLGCVLSCLFILYGLFLSVILPAIQVHYAKVGTFGSCFKIGEITRLATSNLSNYILAWLVYLVFGLVAGLVTGVIPCIGWIAALAVPVLTIMVYGQIFGQFAAKARA